jgi:hypothetical protein
MNVSRHHRMALALAVAFAGVAILAIALFAVHHGRAALACAL